MRNYTNPYNLTQHAYADLKENAREERKLFFEIFERREIY